MALIRVYVRSRYVYVWELSIFIFGWGKKAIIVQWINKRKQQKNTVCMRAIAYSYKMNESGTLFEFISSESLVYKNKLK